MRARTPHKPFQQLPNRVRHTLLACAIALVATAANAEDDKEKIAEYFAVYKDASTFQALVNAAEFEYRRHLHRIKDNAGTEVSIALAVDPSARMAFGWGKGTRSNKNAVKWCKKDRKLKSIKGKCRTMAIDDAFQKPYKP